MPAKLQVDWDEVRTLSIAIGPNEAARQMGIKPASVRQRSKREGWEVTAKKQQERVEEIQRANRVKQGLSPVVTSAAEVFARLGSDSKHKLAIAGNKAVTRYSEMDSEELALPETANAAKAWTGTLGTVHGWRTADTDNPAMALHLHVSCPQPPCIDMPIAEP
jgi:hypothetical protein